MKKRFASPNVSFYVFFILLGVLHFLYFQELRQTMPRIPGIKSILPFMFSSILFVYFFKNIRKNINIYSLTMVIFILFLLSYNIFYYSRYTILSAVITDSIFQKNLFVIYGYLVYYLVGFYYQGYLQFQKSIYFLHMILTINAFIAMDLTTFVISLKNLNLDIFDMYLFLGDSYAMISILTIVLTKSKYLQLFLFLLSTVALYTLMSRTSLYIFVVSMTFYFFVKNKKYFIIYFMITIGIIFFFILSNQELYEELSNSRMLSFLFGAQDASVNARNEYLEVGLKGIKQHWFEGDFGGGTLYYGATGRYIHNYLELFRQYGLTAFVLFSILIMFVLKNIFLWMLNFKKYTRDYDVYIVLSIFILMEIIIGRGINTPYIFFSIGVSIGIYRNDQWIKMRGINSENISH